MEPKLIQTKTINLNLDGLGGGLKNACSNNPNIFVAIFKNKSIVILYCNFMFTQAETLKWFGAYTNYSDHQEPLNLKGGQLFVLNFGVHL